MKNISRDIERIYNSKVSKVNVLRKVGSDICNQDKTCLKYRQAETSVEDILVSYQDVANAQTIPQDIR
jgi:ribosomal protein L23